MAIADNELIFIVDEKTLVDCGVIGEDGKIGKCDERGKPTGERITYAEYRSQIQKLNAIKKEKFGLLGIKFPYLDAFDPKKTKMTWDEYFEWIKARV
jgi:hypothetical protein